MRNRALACLSLLLGVLMVAPIPLRAQSSAWTAYTSMRDLTDLRVDSSSVWAISPGGILHLDRRLGVYNRYTRLDGLASNRVTSLAADSDGNLWFGTEDRGLSRFRPATGRFDPALSEFEGLPVESLAAWGRTLLVGTERGVSAYLLDRAEVKESYRQLGNLPKDTPAQALLIEGNRLWVGTPKGLAWARLDSPNLQDPDSWQAYLSTNVNDLLSVRDTLFCAAGNGVWIVLPETGTVTVRPTASEVLSLGWYNGMLTALDAEGQLWRRRPNGVWAANDLPAISGARTIAQVAPDSALWLATDHGLRVVGGPSPPGSREPSGDAFYDLATTPDGRLYAASVPKDNVTPYGLYELDKDGWWVLGVGDGLSSEYVASVTVDAADRVWAGTWGKGVDVRDSVGVWHHLDQTNSVLRGIGGSGSFVPVSDLEVDAAGLVWAVNVEVGLAVFSGLPPARALLYPNASLGLAAKRDIWRLSLAPNGLKLLGTPLDGFLIFDDGGTPLVAGDEKAQAFNTLNESRLTSNRVADVLADAAGRFWVATDNGLSAIRGTWSRSAGALTINEWRVYNTSSGLPANEVTALTQDAGGRIWVGTTAGLVQIGADGQVAFSLTAANSGLIDDRINSLAYEPATGYLWIGTGNGLSRLAIAPEDSTAPSHPTVYPNPFLLGARGATLTLAGLPLGATVHLYALDGTLVQTLAGDPGKDVLTWDGQNSAGYLAATGVYLFVAEDEYGHRVRGRVAVVRNR